jgi:hypothetical protein
VVIKEKMNRGRKQNRNARRNQRDYDAGRDETV